MGNTVCPYEWDDVNEPLLSTVCSWDGANGIGRESHSTGGIDWHFVAKEIRALPSNDALPRKGVTTSTDPWRPNISN